jgi:hypothetical protein
MIQDHLVRPHSGLELPNEGLGAPTNLARKDSRTCEAEDLVLTRPEHNG